MTALTGKKCAPCSGESGPLAGEALQQMRNQLSAWDLVDGHHLTRTFRFRDFAGGLAFVNRVGELAEKEAHHPDICLSWGKVRIELWTHKVNGLTENDFILAAKIDQLPTERNL
jgi:4a-hydroxytetrahydrobiopterin dehydratase